MEHRENMESKGPSINPRLINVFGDLSRQESTPRTMHTPGDSGHESEIPKYSIIQKAKSVLESELQSRIDRRSNNLSLEFPTVPIDLESMLDQLIRQEPNIIDPLIKVLKNRPEQLAQMASKIISIESPRAGENFQPFPFLKVPSPVSSGQPARIQFRLFNDDPQETADYVLHTSDLIGTSGNKIPATEIAVSPNPSKILPGRSLDGQIEIRVPPGTPPDTYTGLLQAQDIRQLNAIVQLSVAP